MTEKQPVWEGIYENFPEEVPDYVWNSDRWINSLVKNLPAFLINQREDKGTISPHSLVHEYPLPPVVALLGSIGSKKPLRVLDFGGGLGHLFLSCIRSLPESFAIDFHIVESARVCEKGRSIYSDFRNIHFHDQLPIKIETFDIIHVAAALHYVRDWQMLLKNLSDYEPEIILLSALNAGDVKTFVSFQNYYDTKIPVWFLNINDVFDCLKSLGYQLIYKSLLEFSFLGKFQSLPMRNFPKPYRLERKCNLMFAKEQKR